MWWGYPAVVPCIACYPMEMCVCEREGGRERKRDRDRENLSIYAER
jgi:hypothetical protein